MYRLERLLIISRNQSDISGITKAIQAHPEWTQVGIDVTSQISKAQKEISVMGYSLIILDCENFEITPLEMLIQIRGIEKRIPLIVLNQPGNESTAIACLKSGANDYVIKTPNFDLDLPIVIESILHESEYRKELRRQITLLREENVQLKKAKAKDDSSLFYSSKFFEELMTREIKKASRYGIDLCCVVLDLANEDLDILVDKKSVFKAYETIANRLKQFIRSTDIWGRLSNERFAALLPLTNGAQAQTAINRITSEIKSFLLSEQQEHKKLFDIKWGVSTFSQTIKNEKDFLEQAITALH